MANARFRFARWLGRTVLVSLLAVTGACGGGSPSANVLVVTADSLRVDRLRPWAPRDGVPVPALEGLIDRGVRYTNAWTAAPWTAPAVVSVLTGLYPPGHGVVYRDDTTPPDLPALPRVLGRRGYRLGNLSFFSGLSYFRNLGLPEPASGLGHGGAAEAFGRFLEAGEERPFFVWLHLIEPHLPYGATGYQASRVRRSGSSGLEAAQLRATIPVGSVEFEAGDRDSLLELYDRDVAAMDRELGRVLQHLEVRRILDETIVVFVADHGEELLEDGWVGHASTAIQAKMTPEILRVPLVLAGPGVPSGRTVAELVQPLDAYSTVLHLLGIEPPVGEGRVLAPLRPWWSGPRELAFFDSSVGGNLTPVSRRDERLQGVTDGECLLVSRTSAGGAETDSRPLGGECDRRRGAALQTGLEEWRAAQASLRLALLADGAEDGGPAPEVVAELEETIRILEPRRNESLSWSREGGQIRLRWEGSSGPAWIQYRAGRGVTKAEGAFPVEQSVVTFGPFPRGFWNDLAGYSPFRFRVVDEERRRRSPWMVFRVAPLEGSGSS